MKKTGRLKYLLLTTMFTGCNEKIIIEEQESQAFAFSLYNNINTNRTIFCPKNFTPTKNAEACIEYVTPTEKATVYGEFTLEFINKCKQYTNNADLCGKRVSPLNYINKTQLNYATIPYNVYIEIRGDSKCMEGTKDINSYCSNNKEVFAPFTTQEIEQCINNISTREECYSPKWSKELFDKVQNSLKAENTNKAELTDYTHAPAEQIKMSDNSFYSHQLAEFYIDNNLVSFKSPFSTDTLENCNLFNIKKEFIFSVPNKKIIGNYKQNTEKIDMPVQILSTAHFLECDFPNSTKKEKQRTFIININNN